MHAVVVKDLRTTPPTERDLTVYDDAVEGFEALIDLLCGSVLQNGNFAEGVRRQAVDIQLADHRRRLVRNGKHAVTGETEEQYRETMTKNGGIHPVTGENATEMTARLERLREPVFTTTNENGDQPAVNPQARRADRRQ